MCRGAADRGPADRERGWRGFRGREARRWRQEPPSFTPQQHAALAAPDDLPIAGRNVPSPRGDVARVPKVVLGRPIVAGDQRKQLASSKKVAGPVVGIRVAVIPSHHRHHDDDRVAIVRPLANGLQESRELLNAAVGINPEAAPDRIAVDEWKSKKLRLEAEGDDGEEGDQREGSAGCWRWAVGDWRIPVQASRRQPRANSQEPGAT